MAAFFKLGTLSMLFMVVDSFTGIANHHPLDNQIYLVAIYEPLLIMDWAGFEPAISRLRIERSYQAEPPAL